LQSFRFCLKIKSNKDLLFSRRM